MDRPHVRRLARTDHRSESILLNIRQAGATLLDLKLIGTDQEHIYHGKLTNANFQSLQANSHSGGPEAWRAILIFALWQKRTDQSHVDSFQELETVAAITNDILTVTVRKNVGGITQKLGEIKLDKDDEREEISVFDWVDSAVATSDELRNELEMLRSAMTSQKAEVDRLTVQLDELVLAKKPHEDELLIKFAALLNAKKLKIRDQQRLLENARVGSLKTDHIGSAQGFSGRAAGSSRSGKRKADHREPSSDAEMQEAAGEDLASLGSAESTHEEGRLVMTPDHSDDDATASEDDEGESSTPAASRRQTSRHISDLQGEGESIVEIEKIGLPPPRRGLPFNKKPSGKSTNDHVDQQGEDDETDDEL